MRSGAQGTSAASEEPARLDPAAPRVVLITAPDEAVGRTLARALVQERLCACVNVIPGVISIYRWQDAVEEEAEVLLVAKTCAGQLESLEARLAELHPYDVPECVALEPAWVAAPYLQWLRAAVEPRDGTGAEVRAEPR